MTSDEYKLMLLFAAVMSVVLTGTYLHNHRKKIVVYPAKTFHRRRYAKHHWRGV